MNLTLTNNGTVPVPIANRAPWAEVLEPDTPMTVDTNQSVAIIGLKPSVRDQFEQAFETLSASAKALVEAYQNRTLPNMPTDQTPEVAVTIDNHGPNSMRVILGDGVTDHNVAPNSSFKAVAKGYIELRELGLVNPNINQQPSSAA